MNDEFPFDIRLAKRDEWEDAMSLAWKTFLKFEAPDYPPEGIRSFEDFITDHTLYRMFVMGIYKLFVALHGGEIVGLISIRNHTHISLLFVDEPSHKRGIGRDLISYACKFLLKQSGYTRADVSKVTVNAAPYALKFYRRIGFKEIGMETQRDGVRYTPMELLL